MNTALQVALGMRLDNPEWFPERPVNTRLTDCCHRESEHVCSMLESPIADFVTIHDSLRRGRPNFATLRPFYRPCPTSGHLVEIGVAAVVTRTTGGVLRTFVAMSRLDHEHALKPEQTVAHCIYENAQLDE